MDGSQKQHRVKEAKTHMVHKLHDSIYTKWKAGQIVLEARVTTMPRTADSVSSSGSWVEWSVSLGKSRSYAPLWFAHFSLFVQKKAIWKKKYKADITKGLCVCCSVGTETLQVGLLESGLGVEISSQDVGQDCLLGPHHYMPGTGRKQARMAEKGSWDAVMGRAHLCHGELWDWPAKTSPSWCWGALIFIPQ